MRCVACLIVGISLMTAGCSTSRTDAQEPSALLPFLVFSSQASSMELEQGYRFSAMVAGKLREAKAWQGQVEWEREFPEGTPIADVIHSIKMDLSEEFVSQEQGVQWTNSVPDAVWSTNLMIAKGIKIEEARFVPLDAMSQGKIQMSLGGVYMAADADSRPVLSPSVAAPITLAPIASVSSWDPAPEQEHDWQLGRGIDPWIIPEREYVQRRRKNAGLAAFFQFGIWVLSGHSRS